MTSTAPAGSAAPRRQLQSDNSTTTLAAQGVTSGDKMENRWDVSGDVGGRIVRDKLWFYLGAAHSGRASTTTPARSSRMARRPRVSRCWPFDTQKFSYQMSQSNRIVGFYQWNVRSMKSPAPACSCRGSRAPTTSYRQHIDKVEWQAVKGNSLVTSLQYGHWDWNSVYLSGGFTDAVATTRHRHPGAVPATA